MTAMHHVTTAMVRPVVTGWMPGPVDPSSGPVIVSVTHYSSHLRRDLPGVACRGMRLREGWYAMPGAVGVWLWTLPVAGLGGSISVWSDSDALERFITLPRHLDIMARYRDRGSVLSTTWQADLFDPQDTLERAYAWIGEQC
jgi:hypothetical protein